MEQVSLSLPVVRNLYGLAGMTLANTTLTRRSVTNSGKPLGEFLDAGVTPAQLITVGFTAAELLSAGMSPSHVKAGRNSFSHLRGLGDEALRHGWTLEQMGSAEFTAAELQTLGIDVPRLERALALTLSGLMACRTVPIHAWVQMGLTLRHLEAIGANSNHFRALGWGFAQMQTVFKTNEETLERFCVQVEDEADPSSSDYIEHGNFGNEAGVYANGAADQTRLQEKAAARKFRFSPLGLAAGGGGGGGGDTPLAVQSEPRESRVAYSACAPHFTATQHQQQQHQQHQQRASNVPAQEAPSGSKMVQWKVPVTMGGRAERR